MPMKKLTFNSTLNHKAHTYEPMQIEVEKVITLLMMYPNSSKTKI